STAAPAARLRNRRRECCLANRSSLPRGAGRCCTLAVLRTTAFIAPLPTVLWKRSLRRPVCRAVGAAARPSGFSHLRPPSHGRKRFDEAKSVPGGRGRPHSTSLGPFGSFTPRMRKNKMPKISNITRERNDDHRNPRVWRRVIPQKKHRSFCRPPPQC